MLVANFPEELPTHPVRDTSTHRSNKNDTTWCLVLQHLATSSLSGVQDTICVDVHHLKKDYETKQTRCGRMKE